MIEIAFCINQINLPGFAMSILHLMGLWLILLFSGAGTVLSSNSTMNIQVGVIMNDVPFVLDTYHYRPAVDLAIESINKDVQNGKYLNFNLSYVYAVTDSGCGRGTTMKAGGLAADMYINDDIMAYIGPLCSGELAPVANLGAWWNIPVISGVSTLAEFNFKARFTTLTRTAVRASNLADFTVKILRRYGWRRCSLIWDQRKTYARSVLTPTLLEAFPIAEIEYYAFNLQEFETPMEALEAAIVKGRSKYSIGWAI